MRRQRWFKVVRFLVISLLVAEASYVVAANVFLNLGGTEKVLSATDDIRVAYRFAWTLWPGRIHVEGARVVFHDHNLEWSLDADWLDIDVMPSAFLSKTFRASRVRGEGAVFRMRHRVAVADATLASTRALPPIPEFETPALFPAWVPTAPRTDLWRIHAEDVDVGVVEIWAQQARYLGSARARGAFRLHAGHHLWVGPASLDLEPGELTLGNRRFAARFHGHIDCVVHPFLVNLPVGREVLRYVSANIDVHAEEVSLAPLDVFLPPGTMLTSHSARLNVVVGVDQGVLTPESRVELVGPELRGRIRDVTFDTGPFSLDAGSAPDGLGEILLRVERVRAARNEKPRVSLRSGHVALASTSLDTSADWALARVDAVVSRLEIPELSSFDDLVKRHALRLDAGSAIIDASGRYASGAVSGDARAFLASARGRASSVSWEVDGSANVSLGRARTEAHSVERVDAAIDARRLAIREGKLSVTASLARVSAHALLSDGHGSGRIISTAKKASLVVGTLRVGGSVKLDIQLPRINLPKKSYTASASGELGSFEVRFGAGARGRGRRLGFESEVSLADTKVSRGWLQASIKQLSFRAGDTAVSTSADLLVHAKNLDIPRRNGSASATLLLQDFSMIDAVDGARCQWLSLPRAVVQSRLSFTPQREARASVVAELDTLKARWDDFEVAGQARLESRYHEGEVDRITFDVNAKKLRMKSGTGDKKGWEARIPELQLVSMFRRDHDQLSGTIQARAKGLEGRIGRTHVHGNLASDWRLPVLDLRGGEAIGTGDIRIDHAGLRAPGLKVDDWWARVHIPTLSFVAKENLDMSGDFRAEFRDAMPALGMFAASGDLPGWVPDVFPLHELKATGRISRSCRTTDIVIESASGGPLAAAGRIQSVPDDTRGAFLVQLQTPLAVALGLVTYEDEVGLAFMAGNDWLREQSRILDQWALVTSCKPGPDVCVAVHPTATH